MNETTMTIVGNLSADPELKFLPRGDAVVNLTVMSTPRTYDKASGQWKDGTALAMRCTAWRQLAENIAETTARGMRVVVTGRLTQRSFETKEGEKRTVVELDIDELAPSLRYATAKVTKNPKGDSGVNANQNDPWASAPTAGRSGGYDDEAPF